MEQVIKVLTFTLFGASALSFFAGMAFWVAASRCLVPEVGEMFRWNPMNATINPRKNLTPEGRAGLKLTAKAFLLWMGLALLAMMLVPILTLIFGIEVEPRANEKKPPTSTESGSSSR